MQSDRNDSFQRIDCKGVVVIGLLYPIREVKDRVVEMILSSQKVVDLIADDKYKTAPAPGLMYRRVFPFVFIPQTVDRASALVCVEANITSVKSDTVCDVELIIVTMCHGDTMRTDFGTRIDALADEIDELFNHSRELGIGRVTPSVRYPTDYSLPNYGYVARKVKYTIPNFNFRFGATYDG